MRVHVNMNMWRMLAQRQLLYFAAKVAKESLAAASERKRLKIRFEHVSY